MKLRSLLEVRYAGSLEAEEVLYTLWKRRNQIEKDNLSVVKIDDPVLSKKRATAVARYAIRVIASEALDAIGMTDEAQKLRDLLDLKYARDTARNAARVVDHAVDALYTANIAAAAAARAAAHAADHAVYDGGAAARAAARAANYTSRAAGNKQRHLYHLNQMIKLAADIK